MKKIYKYEITPNSGWINVPKCSIVRKVGVQESGIFAWVEVNPSETEIEERCFEVIGTGHEIYENIGVNRNYIDTVFMGELVWHIYERIF